MSKNTKLSIDPVILVSLGIAIVTIAIVMIVSQTDSQTVGIANDSGVLSQLAVAFVTGLTTGGLSCLAVQGGLLASSLAHQIEQDYLEQSAQKRSRRGKKAQPPPQPRSGTAVPILLFLLAKVVAYTL
ncbi:MAG: hypothetical protein ACM33V_12770, partial [Chloroflexota bacterium]|nr:hypothetical protein [Anaerolineales bacterium]